MTRSLRRDAPWLVALVLIFWAAYAFRAMYWPELTARGDALYEVIVAEHLLHGDGFSTNLMPLGGLKVLERSMHLADQPWPSVHKFVGSQARIALVHLFIADPVTALRVASALPYAGLIVLFHLVLARWLRSRPLAFLFALGFMGLDMMFGLALSGLTFTTDSLLFALILICLFRMREGNHVALWLGGLLSVAILHRYSIVLLVPACLLAVAVTTGLRRAAVAALPCVIVVGSFVAWSRARFGITFPSYLGESLILHQTKYLPFDPWYVFDWPVARAAILADPGTFVEKTVRNLRSCWETFTLTPLEGLRNAVLIVLAGFGVRRLLRAGKFVRRIVIVLGLFAGAFSLSQMVLSSSALYLIFLLVPFWWCFALGLSEIAGRAWKKNRTRSRMLACAAALVLLLAPEARAAWQTREALTSPTRPRCQADELCNRQEIVAALTGLLPAGSVLVGGTSPWEIAAFVPGLKVIPLVPSPQSLIELRARGLTVHAVLVTKAKFAGVGLVPDGWLEWQNVSRTAPRTFFDYALTKTFSDGTLLYVRDPTRAGNTTYPDSCLEEPVFHAREQDDLTELSAEWGGQEEDHAGHWWVTLHGKSGRYRFYACAARAAAETLTVTFIAPKGSDISLSMNGHELPHVLVERTGWHTMRLSVPRGATVRGTNAIEVRSSMVDQRDLSIALELITLE